MGFQSKSSSKQVIFRRRPELSDEAMLTYFEQILLAHKADGVYLIRESRVPGMLTMSSFDDDGEIEHFRFAFMVDNNQGQWVHVTGDHIESTQQSASFIPTDAANVALLSDAWPQLLSLIVENGYKTRINPEADQATESSLYKNYVYGPNFLNDKPEENGNERDCELAQQL